MAHRRLAGRTDRIVIVGAGLGGLSAALRLTGAGREVVVLEAAEGPGGLMGRWQSGGYTFDTGPSVLTMPNLIDDALACVGESRSDWLELSRLDPSYRATFADGSTLRSFADVEQMSEEVARVCGPGEVRGYRDLVDYLTALYRTEFETFMNRNLDSMSDLVRPEALTLLRLGGLRGLQHCVDRFVTDDRLSRLFTFQAMYAGLAPAKARALYGVIPYLDSVAGVWFPRGGMYRVAEALAGAAAKHGARFRYRTPVRRVEVSGDQARAVITEQGERIEADAVILNTDLQYGYGSLLPADLAPRRLSRS
ncbi:MAG TPA: phytoene desaturase family protein, partial [Jatrophihabitans sp.]